MFTHSHLFYMLISIHTYTYIHIYTTLTNERSRTLWGGINTTVLVASSLVRARRLDLVCAFWFVAGWLAVWLAGWLCVFVWSDCLFVSATVRGLVNLLDMCATHSFNTSYAVISGHRLIWICSISLLSDVSLMIVIIIFDDDSLGVVVALAHTPGCHVQLNRTLTDIWKTLNRSCPLYDSNIVKRYF